MRKEELGLLLESELEKPVAEIDSELVQQILEILETAPSPEQQRTSWERIKSLIIANDESKSDFCIVSCTFKHHRYIFRTSLVHLSYIFSTTLTIWRVKIRY